MYLEINVNTSDSPSHIPTVFGFGPGLAKCEQHAYPTAVAFLSYTLEVIDLIAKGNVFHIRIHTHTHTHTYAHAHTKTEVGNLDVLPARVLFHCFRLKAKMMLVTFL